MTAIRTYIAIFYCLALATACATLPPKSQTATPAAAPTQVQAQQSQPSPPPAALITPTTDNIPLAAKSIGIILPLSGPYKNYGLRALAALQIGFGLPTITPDPAPITVQQGDTLSLIIGDSQGKAELAIQLVDLLATKYHVLAMLGDILSDTGLAVARKAEALQIPNISFARSPGIAETGPYSFHFGLTPQKQARVLVQHAMRDLSLKRFGVLYPKHRPGMEMMHAFVEEVKQQGGTVTSLESYESNETTFTEHAKRLLGKSALPNVPFEGLLIPDFPKTVSYIIPALVAANILVSHDQRIGNIYRRTTGWFGAEPIYLLGPSSWHSNLLGERLGSQMDGAFFAGGVDFSASDPVTTQFRTNFDAAQHAEPTLMEAQCFDIAMLVKSMVQAKKGKFSRTSFRDQLAETQGFQGISGPISFDKDGDSLTPPHLFMFEDGNIKPIRVY